MRADPKEKDRKYRDIILKAEQEAERNVTIPKDRLGYCHALWSEQKRILKEKYNIAWRTPAEMNPDVIFD